MVQEARIICKYLQQFWEIRAKLCLWRTDNLINWKYEILGYEKISIYRECWLYLDIWESEVDYMYAQLPIA